MNVHSIFESISGEAGITIPQGSWTTFIRLQGCNLQCMWPCDTQDTQNPSIMRMQLSVEEIARQAQTENVLITGGEPLLQSKDLFDLINELEMNNHLVQVETNGSLKWNGFLSYGSWVVDYKCPSSHMQRQMLPLKLFAEQLENSLSIVKFVIDVGEDGLDILDYNFMWAKIFDLNSYGYRGRFIVSPLDGKPESLKRIAGMLSFMPAEFRSRIILSLQIHKVCGLA